MKHVVWMFVVMAACGSTPKAVPAENPVEQVVDDVTADVVPEAYEVVTEPVEFASGDLKLVGTLIRPLSKTPRPGAVLVADWGIRGRDGVVAEVFGVRFPTEIAVYRALAEGLAARGVAVLIYDKRNCAKDSEPWCQYPADYATANPALGSALVADARAAFAWLDARPEIAPVSFIGHGHGAEVALAAAGRARVVLLQPSTQSLVERARFQLEESVRQIDARIATVGDVPEADLLKARKAEVQAMLDAPDVLNLEAAAVADLDELHRRYLEIAGGTTPDRLAIFGDVDPGESPQEPARLEELFAQDLQVIAGLSRAMVSLADDADPTVVSPEVLARVSAFLAADLPQ